MILEYQIRLKSNSVIIGAQMKRQGEEKKKKEIKKKKE